MWLTQQPTVPPPASKPAEPPPPILTDLTVGTVGEGPTGTLQRQVQILEDQNQLLQKENQDLRTRLSKALEANTPPPTAELLAERLEALREMKFITPPKFTAVPIDALQQRVLQHAQSLLPEASARAHTSAFLLMNFVGDEFDYGSAMANAFANQGGSFYDPKTHEAFYQNDVDLRRIDGRDRVCAAALGALQAQHFPASAALPLCTEQDDAACALRALALGETAFYRIRWSLQDDLVNRVEGDPPQFLRQDYTPLYFSEQFKMCLDQGQNFVEALLQKDGPAGLTAAYERPPQSTAEILHPELYLAQPPFTPMLVDAAEGQGAGLAPTYTNVAGEFSTDISFRYFMSPDIAIRIADGWAGDRYWLYPNATGSPEHLLWKTHWRTPEDGQEFFDGLRRTLMKRFTIPYLPAYDQPGAFLVDDPHRIIHLRISADRRSVTLVNTTDPTLAAALDTPARRP